jgi:hypothetical protein
MLLYLGSATVTIVSHAHLNKAKGCKEVWADSPAQTVTKYVI